MTPTELAAHQHQLKKLKIDQDLVERYLAHVNKMPPGRRSYWVLRVNGCATASGKEGLMRRVLE